MWTEATRMEHAEATVVGGAFWPCMAPIQEVALGALSCLANYLHMRSILIEVATWINILSPQCMARGFL